MIGTLAMHVSAKEHATELRERRLKAGLSQVGLATLLGVSRRTICRWEAGRGRLHHIWLWRIRNLRHTTPVEVPHAQQQI